MDFYITTTITIIGIFIAVFGVYYTRHSYLLTLKTFETDKNRTFKAKHYYDTYINIPPSKTVCIFTKKVDSDELNETIKFPSIYTDFLIKNYPDHYFHYASLLKKCWTYFEIEITDRQMIIKCKIKHFYLWGAFYFSLYFIFASSLTFLVLFNNQIISRLSDDSPWGAIYIITLVVIGLAAFTIASLHKTTQISDVKRLNDTFSKMAPK